MKTIIRVNRISDNRQLYLSSFDSSFDRTEMMLGAMLFHGMFKYFSCDKKANYEPVQNIRVAMWESEDFDEIKTT